MKTISQHSQMLRLANFITRKTDAIDGNGIHYITWDNLKEVMGMPRYQMFIGWLRGQNCLAEGAYPQDVQAFLNVIYSGEEGRPFD